jgi:hypothetical protein
LFFRALPESLRCKKPQQVGAVLHQDSYRIRHGSNVSETDAITKAAAGFEINEGGTASPWWKRVVRKSYTYDVSDAQKGIALHNETKKLERRYGQFLEPEQCC